MKEKTHFEPKEVTAILGIDNTQLWRIRTGRSNAYAPDCEMLTVRKTAAGKDVIRPRYPIQCIRDRIEELHGKDEKRHRIRVQLFNELAGVR